VLNLWVREAYRETYATAASVANHYACQRLVWHIGLNDEAEQRVAREPERAVCRRGERASAVARLKADWLLSGDRS
jgi:hypothetical protein